METKMVEALRNLMSDLAKLVKASEDMQKTTESAFMSGLYAGQANGYSLAADLVQDVLAELLKKETK